MGRGERERWHQAFTHQMGKYKIKDFVLTASSPFEKDRLTKDVSAMSVVFFVGLARTIA
jgi:hypothetical protein